MIVDSPMLEFQSKIADVKITDPYALPFHLAGWQIIIAVFNEAWSELGKVRAGVNIPHEQWFFVKPIGHLQLVQVQCRGRRRVVLLILGSHSEVLQEDLPIYRCTGLELLRLGCAFFSGTIIYLTKGVPVVGKVAVSWLKIVGLWLGLAPTILSHETATTLWCLFCWISIHNSSAFKPH